MLSIIIPCFNHSDTLPRAIRSAQQIRGTCEIIVVDDCSTDIAAEAMETLVADTNVQYFRNAVNSGPGFSRNHGVRMARGEYITFLDADDELIHPGLYEDACSAVLLDAGIRAIKANMEFFDPIKGWILPDYDPRYASAVLSSSCATVIRRDLLMQMGGFPEGEVFRGPHGGEDVAFMQALIDECGPIGKIDAVSYRVWSRDGGHADRFLARTRLNNSGFEFVGESGVDLINLENAVQQFKQEVAYRIR